MSGEDPQTIVLVIHRGYRESYSATGAPVRGGASVTARGSSGGSSSSTGGGGGASSGAGAGASVGVSGGAPSTRTSDLRISTRETGWIGLQAAATSFAMSPEMTAFTTSPTVDLAANVVITFAVTSRITRCFDPWIRRSVIAIGFTRIVQPSFVVAFTTVSVRVRFLRVRRRM